MERYVLNYSSRTEVHSYGNYRVLFSYDDGSFTVVAMPTASLYRDRYMNCDGRYIYRIDYLVARFCSFYRSMEGIHIWLKGRYYYLDDNSDFAFNIHNTGVCEWTNRHGRIVYHTDDSLSYYKSGGKIQIGGVYMDYNMFLRKMSLERCGT